MIWSDIIFGNFQVYIWYNIGLFIIVSCYFYDCMTLSLCSSLLIIPLRIRTNQVIRLVSQAKSGTLWKCSEQITVNLGVLRPKVSLHINISLLDIVKDEFMIWLHLIS